jgi:hypothetical protein
MAVITPELERLSEAIEHLDAVRRLFLEMDDDGERERAWAYLSSRFAEYEKAEMPGWENLEDTALDEYEPAS